MIVKNKTGVGLSFFVMPATIIAWLFFVSIWTLMDSNTKSGVEHFVAHAKDFSFECSNTRGVVKAAQIEGETLTFSYLTPSEEGLWNGTIEGTVVDDHFEGTYRSTLDEQTYEGEIRFRFSPDGSAVGGHQDGVSRIVKEYANN